MSFIEDRIPKADLFVILVAMATKTENSLKCASFFTLTPVSMATAIKNVPNVTLVK